MNDVRDKKSVSQLLHQHLLKLIVLSYGLAAVYPMPGLWIKECKYSRILWDIGRLGDHDSQALVVAAAVAVRACG